MPRLETLRAVAGRPPEGGTFGPSAAPVDDGGSAPTLGEMGFEARPGGKYEYRDPDKRFTVAIAPDGRISFRTPPVRLDLKLGQQAKLRFGGPAEAAMRAGGQERLQRDKLRITKATEALRLRMAIAYTRARIEEQRAALPRELDRVWMAIGVPDDRRRRNLFQLWDDCEEPLLGAAIPLEDTNVDGELDRIRRQAGSEARKVIETYIRTELPKGSQIAFTDVELQELNQGRRSKARFAPYE